MCRNEANYEYTVCFKKSVSSSKLNNNFTTSNISKEKYHFSIKDPGSAITHFIGMVTAIIGTAPLIMKATHSGDIIHVVSLSIFIISMILLYGASTAYHTFDISDEFNKVLKKLDHCMIFILIAGSYTPLCLIVLHGKTGYMLLSLVWGIAFVELYLSFVG